MELAAAPIKVTNAHRVSGRLSLFRLSLIAILAAGSFNLGFFLFPPLLLFYAYFLLNLSDAPRTGFRFGFLVGMAVFAPHLFWFWKIFGPVAICLWAVLSFFTGLFVLGVTLWRIRFRSRFLWIVIPVLWTGMEFFRSELYYLRFSWLTPGYTLLSSSHFPAWLGVYGSGFLLFLLSAIAFSLPKRRKLLALAAAFALLTCLQFLRLPLIPTPKAVPSQLLRVAGIQLEFPPELQIPDYLDSILALNPNADLFLLGEYTFDGTIPPRVRAWCKNHQKYLVAGGKKSADGGAWYNCAFVIGADGEQVFEQAKSVPIQFFADGLPATEQNVWNSPWGKIGICICYDLSYRNVVDSLVQQGAQALIVPFMDVSEWGAYQHRLHSMVPPVRAREYQIPIFRVGSSGISQLINKSGAVTAMAPFPGQESIISGNLQLAAPGRLPIDHWLAPGCSIVSGFFFLALFAFRKPIAPSRKRTHFD